MVIEIQKHVFCTQHVACVCPPLDTGSGAALLTIITNGGPVHIRYHGSETAGATTMAKRDYQELVRALDPQSAAMAGAI